MCTTYWLVLGGVALVQDNSLQPPRHGLHEVLEILDVVHLQCPQKLDLLLELWQTGGFGVLDCFRTCFRGTLAFQSSTATRLSSIEKFGTALEGVFLLASLVPLLLILKRPHAVLFICSQTKSFRLKTVNFRVEQPETHRDTEKKTAGL